MSAASEHLNKSHNITDSTIDTTEVSSTGKNRLFNRRNISKGIGAGAVVAALLGVRYVRNPAKTGEGSVAPGSESIPGGDTDQKHDVAPAENPTKEITSEQSLANISSLEQDADFFADGVDPTVLTKMSPEQRFESTKVEITAENAEDEQVLAQDILDKLLLIARAGSTEQDITESITIHKLPVGVRNERGSLLTNTYNGPDGHAKRVRSDFGIPMVDGFCPDEYDSLRMIAIKDKLLELQYSAAKAFEFNATTLKGGTAPDPSLNTKMIFEMVGEAQSLNLADSGFPTIAELALSNPNSAMLENAGRMKINFIAKLNTGGPAEKSLTLTYLKDPGTENYLLLPENYYEAATN